MKILIIGTPRSGTTVLIRTLGAEMGYKRYGEPWNKHIYFENYLPKFYQFDNDSIVKTLVHNLRHTYPEDDILELYTEVVKQFDRVIVLGRRNTQEILESYTYQMEQGDRYAWHDPYIIENPSTLPTHKYREDIEDYCELLIEVSKHLNIPITWYEDLYSGNIEVVKPILDSWDLPVDTDRLLPHLHPSKRIRRVSSIL